MGVFEVISVRKPSAGGGGGGEGQPSVSLEGQTLQFPSFLESFSSSSSFAQTGSPVTLVYAAVRWVFSPGP